MYHWTGWFKPWFVAHCRTLPRNASLVTGPGDLHGKKRFKFPCPPGAVPGVPEYLFWQILREALAADAAADVLAEWGVDGALRSFRGPRGAGCAMWVSRFPRLRRWCDAPDAET